jgi:hypothetical protein
MSTYAMMPIEVWEVLDARYQVPQGQGWVALANPGEYEIATDASAKRRWIDAERELRLAYQKIENMQQAHDRSKDDSARLTSCRNRIEDYRTLLAIARRKLHSIEDSRDRAVVARDKMMVELHLVKAELVRYKRAMRYGWSN